MRWFKRLIRCSTPAGGTAIDREAGVGREQAAAHDAGAPVILGWAVIALVKFAPDRRAPARAAEVNRLAHRVTAHLAPVVVKHSADAPAQIAHDDGAVLQLGLVAHVIPPRITIHGAEGNPAT